MSTVTCGGMKFAAKLKSLMIERRFSQAELGNRLGCSQNLVGRWTRGVSVPSLSLAALLARILGVELEYLGDDSLDHPTSSPAEVAAVKLVRALRLDEDEVIRRLYGDHAIKSRVVLTPTHRTLDQDGRPALPKPPSLPEPKKSDPSRG